MPFLMSFALEREIVTLAWIDYVSVQFPLNMYATKGFIGRRLSVVGGLYSVVSSQWPVVSSKS